MKDSKEKLLQILFQLEQKLKDATCPKIRRDLERSIRGTKLVLKRLLVVSLIFLNGPEDDFEDYEMESEVHLSWELGTNDSIPETEVIIDPYDESTESIELPTDL